MTITTFRCAECDHDRDRDDADVAPCRSCGVCGVCAPTSGGSGGSDLCGRCDPESAQCCDPGDTSCPCPDGLEALKEFIDDWGYNPNTEEPA